MANRYPTSAIGTSGRDCVACKRRLCTFQSEKAVAGASLSITLERGERLEASNASCLRFWTIVSGTAAICCSFEDGRRQILGLESAGDTICAAMSCNDSAIWLEALEDCQICELDFSGNAMALRSDPAFISAVFGVTHQRLETTSRHLTTLGRLDSTERVILFLADMASRCARATVSLPMSREDIADYLGLNAETVSRILSRLRKSGLVKFLSPTEYTIPDVSAIARRLPVPVPEHAPKDHFAALSAAPAYQEGPRA